MAEIKFLYICISTAWGDNLMTRLGMVLDEYTIHELESRTTCIIEYNAINDTGYGFYSCTALAEPLMDENGTGGNRRRSIILKQQNLRPNPTHLPQVPTPNNTRSGLQYGVETSYTKFKNRSSPAIPPIIQFVICFGPACFEYSSGRKLDHGYQLEACIRSTDIHLVI
ncbi:hypothetical protein BofuT4_P072120.1 [Botrytis cinerea T4]|uniref:Uncharacterized protein n=1 Tax=Botryotinia fuckeliana (strain T4) TaxID=999810 RepID=G2XQ28_BOTF4|nr:hypothetical protein BofuT4_P072120.1 [Botrytis cinerea T4]